jgi:uncharacterized membrane protein
MNNEQRELSLIELVGVIIFSFGFIFELVADSELYFFKKLNRGKILDKGTWSLSRHPNYFGEILVWWGFFFIALPASKGLATLISPLMITFLLLKISGIPMLEKILTKKGQDFLKYQKTTPAILPFALKQIFTFALISTTLIICDAIWLGFLAGDFYQKNLTGLTRITNGKWDPNLGAALLVYFFLALSISYFAVCQSKLQSFFKGAILGMCIYGVYDFTNLALLRDWPMTIALVDVLWGTTLCGIASALGSILGPHKIGSPSSQ